MSTQVEKLICKNPATGEQFGEVIMTTPEQVNLARREMAAAAPVWARKPVAERIRILKQLQEVLVEAVDEISSLINLDCGKSRQDALTELFVTLDILKQYCKDAPKQLRSRRISPGLQIFKRAYMEYHPFGVVGVIGPWNYPFVLIVPPIIAALLAGNTVMVKPSEVTAATGQLIERLFQRVPELAPFVRFLHGDGRVGEALVKSKPDLVFLTGSTATGRKVMQTAAATLTPVTCELGGKDPMIVLEDADIAAAAQWGAWGAFYNSGQTCMAVERVYVVEAVYDQFVQEVIEATKRIKVGYSPEPLSEYDMGPLTFERQVNIVNDHFQDAIDNGAQVLLGGKMNGMFMEPTIMTNVHHGMKLMREETFGPILPIIKVKNEDEAVALSNDSEYGLSASVWGRDLRRAERVARRLEVGSVNINDTITHFGIPHLPFGGIKQSGVGRTHGADDLRQFTQTRSYVIGNPPLPIDIATILRAPGHYNWSKLLIQVLYGTREQKLQPIKEQLAGQDVKAGASKVAVLLGITAVFAAIVLNLSKKSDKA